VSKASLQPVKILTLLAIKVISVLFYHSFHNVSYWFAVGEDLHW